MLKLHAVTLESGYTDRESRRDRSQVWIYIDLKNESIIENLFARHSRPADFYRSIVIVELAKRGVEPTKVVWKQRLGCKCGCSPGFLVVIEDGTMRKVLEDEVVSSSRIVGHGTYPLTLNFEIDIH